MTTNKRQSARVIIGGYGPVGLAAAQKLREIGFDIVIIDQNPDTVKRQLELGNAAFHGDVSNVTILKKADLQSADVLILAIPDEEVAVAACAAARRLSPRIFIVARTNFLSRGLLATEAGADKVIVEEVVTADAMQNAVTEHLAAAIKNNTI